MCFFGGKLSSKKYEISNGRKWLRNTTGGCSPWGSLSLPFFCLEPVKKDITASPRCEMSLAVTWSSRVLNMQGAWAAICVGTGTPKTEGDIPWMLWARVADLSLGRNKATGEVIRARSTTGSRDLQLHQWAEAALTQNWASWKRRSCFCIFCADLSVRFLYLS